MEKNMEEKTTRDALLEQVMRGIMELTEEEQIQLLDWIKRMKDGNPI
jgi:hypothetical protein